MSTPGPPDLPPPTGPPVIPAGPSGMPSDVPPPQQGQPQPQGQPETGSPGVLVDGVEDEGWNRLSTRMLVVHPVRTLMSMAVPLLLVAFGPTLTARLAAQAPSRRSDRLAPIPTAAPAGLAG